MQFRFSVLKQDASFRSRIGMTRLQRSTTVSKRGVIAGFLSMLTIMALVGFLSNAYGSSTSTHPDVTPNTCGLPSYLTSLASVVQKTPRFITAAAGASYELVTGNNQSASVGVSEAHIVNPGSNSSDTSGAKGATVVEGGTPYYSPPQTHMMFYSYGATLPAGCANVIGDIGVTGVIEVSVPLSLSGSYVLSNMTLVHWNSAFGNYSGSVS